MIPIGAGAIVQRYFLFTYPPVFSTRSPHPPSETVNSHIRLLHTYNELRDIGTGLMGLLADQRGVRVREVMAEFGVGDGD